MRSSLVIRLGRWMAAAGALSGAGRCYSLVPMDASPSPSAPTELQVDLTDEGRLRLAGVVGRQAEYVRGRLVAAEADTLRVAVSQVVTMNGDYFTWTGETVPFPRQYIGRASVRTLDKVRTSLVVGLGAAALGTAVGTRLFGFAGGDTPTNPSPGGPGGPAN